MSKFWAVVKLIISLFLISAVIIVMITFLVKTMTLSAIMQSVVINVLSGIFVSFAFILLLLSYLRPKFQISPHICYRENNYWFKIVNRSIYHAFDAKIELFIMQPINHSAGKANVNIISVPLTTSNMTSVNRFRRNDSSKDPFALYALTVFTTADIETFLKKNNTYLEFQLTVRHGLTGLADRFVQQFPNETVIRPGHKFCRGKNLGTMPENQSF